MKIRITDNEFGDMERIEDLADLIYNNANDQEFMACLPRLATGHTVVLGGGAVPLLWLSAVRQ